MSGNTPGGGTGRVGRAEARRVQKQRADAERAARTRKQGGGQGDSLERIEIPRVAANEETAVLTPISAGTRAIDRIPVGQRNRWIIVTSALGVLVLTLGILTGYLWNVSRQWEAQVTEVNAANIDLGSRLADESAEVARQQQQLDLLTEQLKTAQQRILELADDKAQAGDDVQFYAAEIANLNTLLTTASAVANAMNRCVEGQAQLVEYIRNADKYDAEELQKYENSVKTLCDNAVSANVELQKVLTR